MLKSFCGKKKDSPLVSIVYDSEFVFSNGCRSPPWRQIYGELCYLIVQTVEERLVVTASKKGFFVNKGYCTDAEGMLMRRIIRMFHSCAIAFPCAKQASRSSTMRKILRAMCTRH